MWDAVPWFVGGGAEHGPEVARLLAYAATSGAEGVVGVGDLKVTALDVPGTAVRVLPGAAVMLNSFPGGQGQSYIGRNPVAHEAEVEATTSMGSRTDMVVARVRDPQYAGVVPEDPTNFQYMETEVVRGVPSSARSARDLNLPYPAVALARITIPSSTATITNSMITDLRRVANPRRERTLHTVFGTGDKLVSGWRTDPLKFETWPIRPSQRPSVYVPPWASRMDLVANFTGIYFSRGQTTIDTRATIRTGFAGSLSNSSLLIQDLEDTGGRYSFSAIGSHSVPLSARGTTQQIDIQCMRTAGRGSWYADDGTSIAIDVEFTEVAE